MTRLQAGGRCWRVEVMNVVGTSITIRNYLCFIEQTLGKPYQAYKAITCGLSVDSDYPQREGEKEVSVPGSCAIRGG